MKKKKEKFAERMKQVRGEQSQRQFAKDTGIERSALVRYEQGQGNPRMTRLWELADYFNVTLDWLVGRKK